MPVENPNITVIRGRIYLALLDIARNNCGPPCVEVLLRRPRKRFHARFMTSRKIRVLSYGIAEGFFDRFSRAVGCKRLRTTNPFLEDLDLMAVLKFGTARSWSRCIWQDLEHWESRCDSDDFVDYLSPKNKLGPIMRECWSLLRFKVA